MRIHRSVFAIVALSLAMPLVAQGSKVSEAIELATAPEKLKPGQWVWDPGAASGGHVTVLVDLTSQLAFIYRNGINIGVSTISSGKPGHETPTGVFTILQKDANHHSSTYNNAPMYFQERLTWDGVALHAGGLPGYPESHGCVHLPYAFAKALFAVTDMGGTVVVTGRAGTPIHARAGGVLAPIAEGGGAALHQPLPDDKNWQWRDDGPQTGPLSIVVSTSDERIVVMRNGEEIARSRAVIEGDRDGTHVAILEKGEDGKPHWMLVGVPGHEGEGHHAVDATMLERLRMPKEFHRRLHSLMEPGATVLVTSASVGAHNSGKQLSLLSAIETADAL
ncbi:L,D-transpeptidase family protein [Qipengyuania sp. RANM35]|uniref:L,D-transpeptidase family protein n=1 Tax=Qipengyuania sp. RANM35 TaxID=3068635 RepID=UPI0034DB41F4